MKRHSVLCVTALVLALVVGGNLRADLITVSTGGAFFATPAPGADTLTLSPTTNTFNVPFGQTVNIGVQPANFFIGDSGTTNQVFPFTINESVTINGVTQTVPISGQFLITPAQDTLTLFAGPPTSFQVPGGEVDFATQGFSLTSGALGNHPFTVPGTLSLVPEPGSLALFGLVIAGAAGYGWGRSKRMPNKKER
jgi:hypothetical protein